METVEIVKDIRAIITKLEHDSNPSREAVHAYDELRRLLRGLEMVLAQRHYLERGRRGDKEDEESLN